ncbi:hypothetical protein [Paenibacillus xylanexedens]|uniref:hypothetical protein n=1 Tax=Paenibacillus xylanexedens TaxID=528191 RepID=UPI00119D7E78|nr:hypothetical protein [Paenibacillus xylanexedens]
MFTLYKKKPDGKLLYAEYWIEDGQLVEHVGTVGTIGTSSRIDFPGEYQNEDEFKRNFLSRYTSQGYEEASKQEGVMLLIQYPMKSLSGSKRDLWLRDKATEALTSELGWRGLGFVDGFDMGKTTNPVEQYALNIYCHVVDEKLGIQAVKRVLKETRLDHTQIKIASKVMNRDAAYVLQYSTKKNSAFYV